MKAKEKRFYMQCALSASEMSHDKKTQVGAVLVDTDQNDIISYGYNGTPTGFDNRCKDEQGNTKPSVLHAESNIVGKTAKTNKSSDGAVLFVTLSPCYNCAKLIIQSGIREVYFLEEYRDTSGVELLKKANIKAELYSID